MDKSADLTISYLTAVGSALFSAQVRKPCSACEKSDGSYEALVSTHILMIGSI